MSGLLNSEQARS